MHICEILLQEAFALAAREADALELENAEDAVELSQIRAGLLNRVWQERNGFDEAVLKERLIALSALQNKLAEKAEAHQESLRQKLDLRKKQEGYFKDSRKRYAESQKAFYLSKKS